MIVRHIHSNFIHSWLFVDECEVYWNIHILCKKRQENMNNRIFSDTFFIWKLIYYVIYLVKWYLWVFKWNLDFISDFIIVNKNQERLPHYFKNWKMMLWSINATVHKIKVNVFSFFNYLKAYESVTRVNIIGSF